MRGLKILVLVLTFAFSSCEKEDLPEIDFVPVANAGNPQSIQLPLSSVTLTGTGSSQNGKIIGYLWSLVSGPNVPVIASPSSPSTAVNSLIAGTYIFQFAVIDSIGLTGVDTTSIIVKPAPIQTLTFQPAANHVDELNFALWGTQNASAHDIDLDAGAWTWNGLPLLIRGAFKFDLSAIPTTATIVSAKLSLYSNPTPINGDLTNANSGSNNAMYIRRITSSWNGTTATWQTQPTTTTADQILIPHTNLSTLDLVDIDVKNLVTSMHASGNYGFMMNLQNEQIYTIRQFASSNHSNASKRPKLVVVYQ